MSILLIKKNDCSRPLGHFSLYQLTNKHVSHLSKKEARNLSHDYWEHVLTTKEIKEKLLINLLTFLQKKPNPIPTTKPRLLIYMPLKNELDCREIFTNLTIPDLFDCYLPKVFDTQKRSMDFFLYKPGDPIQKGAFGIWEPENENKIEYPLSKNDICILPTLATNKNFARLGKGQGYYDRRKEQLEKALCIALLPKKLSDLNFEDKEYDLKLHIIIHEEGLCENNRQTYR